MKILLLFGTFLPVVVVFAGLSMNTVTLPRSELRNMKAATGALDPSEQVHSRLEALIRTGSPASRPGLS